MAVVTGDGRTLNIDKPSARLLPLDRVSIGSGTTNDLLEIWRRRPDLMTLVPPSDVGA